LNRSQIRERGREGAKSAGVRKHRDKKAQPWAMQKLTGLPEDAQRDLLRAMKEVSLQESIVTHISSGTIQTGQTAADTMIANADESSETDKLASFVTDLLKLEHKWNVQSLCTRMETNSISDANEPSTSMI
jgi:hypothetical protein